MPPSVKDGDGLILILKEQVHDLISVSNDQIRNFPFKPLLKINKINTYMHINTYRLWYPEGTENLGKPFNEALQEITFIIFTTKIKYTTTSLPYHDVSAVVLCCLCFNL